ncbi:MAG: ATP-dependent zinc metalloprotease FtsH [Planctomycetota bacterium]|nr:MAG: ATP-dependent zinc metalloprotease FtsH [Planctomycetota bacterium]
MLVMFLSYSQSGNRITMTELEKHIAAGDLVKDRPVIVREDAIIAEIMQPEMRSGRQTVMVQTNSATKEKYVERLMELGVEIISPAPSPWFQLLLFFGPVLLIMLVIWMMVSRGLRGAAGGAGMLGNFGKSRHQRLTKEMTGITFKDVAGIDEAKEEVLEIIEFLKNPKKFTRLGGRIPRGVLLIGDPGCGKTLLAKAIAGEADVPFFSISGSDFVEMFVGVGASRVRDLFKQAKESAPCIIFLDEIDAVGRRRGGGFSSGGNDEREQTLNAILVEMDGFNSGDGVIVIAATNRGDVLDPALTRPGRFDRQITVPLPDLHGRLEILKVHARKVKMGPDVDLEKIARGTPMFSGADLAAIINEAAIAATMQNKDFIEHEDLEEARDKVKFGRARKSRVREKEESKLVAYHEAGHAVLQATLKDADPLHKVTIIPRGSAGGATFSLPEKDRMGFNLKWLRATMRVLCGGRIAEARAMNDTSSGAAQDISQVTHLARTMITAWGMSEKLGFVRYAGADTREFFMPERDYSEETARLIDEETRRIVDEAYDDAERMINEHWEQVVAVAEALLKYETLTADEVHMLIRGESLGKPSVADLLQADQTAEKKQPKTSSSPDEQTGSSPEGVPSPA